MRNATRRTSVGTWLGLLSHFVLLSPLVAFAQAPPKPAPLAAAAEHEGAELAKKLLNPVSDLVSIPQFGIGAYVAGPENGPEWQLRAAVVVLLPRRR